MAGIRDLADGGRILVRTPNWIGDAVFAEPAIRALGNCGARPKLVLFGPRKICDLLAALEGVEEVAGWAPGSSAGIRRRLRAAFNLRARRANLALVFPESFSSALEMRLAGAGKRIGRSTQGRGALLTERIRYGAPPRSRHLVDEYLELVENLGLEAVDRMPRIPVAPEAAEEAARILPGEDGLLRIGFVPGAAFGAAKRWPPDRFVELGRRFEGAEIVLFGSAEERYLAEHISSGLRARSVVLAGRTSVPVLAACLARCSMVVGNDTGPTHLAAAVGAAVVGIYGSTNPVWTGLRSPKARVLYREMDCSPCYARQCDRDYACLHRISVDDAWDTCRDLLAGAGARTARGDKG